MSYLPSEVLGYVMGADFAQGKANAVGDAGRLSSELVDGLTQKKQSFLIRAVESKRSSNDVLVFKQLNYPV